MLKQAFSTLLNLTNLKIGLAYSDGTEVNKAGYSRQVIPNWTFSYTNGVIQITNPELINFGMAMENWGTISKFLLFNANNEIVVEKDILQKTVNQYDTIIIPPNALVITISENG